MAPLPLAERTLSQLDVARLTRRLQTGASPVLADCLDEAAVVEPDQVPGDLITMNSVFTVKDLQSGVVKKLTLCYPEATDPNQGHISVLSPAGTSLLGLRVGEVAAWRSPQGQEHAAVVEEVLFQPEAAGDFTL